MRGVRASSANLHYRQRWLIRKRNQSVCVWSADARGSGLRGHGPAAERPARGRRASRPRHAAGTILRTELVMYSYHYTLQSTYKRSTI